MENQRRIHLDVNFIRQRRRQGLDFSSTGERLPRIVLPIVVLLAAISQIVLRLGGSRR